MTSLLRLLNVDFAYGRRKILVDISLDFAPCQVVSLLGPNGSGKTTLLKIILGILRPKTGNVLLEGRPLHEIPGPELAGRIAYVPQVHREAFAYSVEDVVLMGRMPYHSLFSVFTRQDRTLSLDAMERLGIAHLKDRAYTEISGGERQLALIARSLAQGADIFVMDEPVNGLDYGNQMRLLGDINRLAKEGLTFIMTTHFPDHALLTADRTILFDNGGVVADGPPKSVITRDALFALYRIEVDLVPTPGDGRVCVPSWALG